MSWRRQRFTERLGGAVSRAALEKQFDRLILAAPPRTLGILRKSLSSHATERVIAELDKDLTKSSSDRTRGAYRSGISRSETDRRLPHL